MQDGRHGRVFVRLQDGINDGQRCFPSPPQRPIRDAPGQPLTADPLIHDLRRALSRRVIRLFQGGAPEASVLKKVVRRPAGIRGATCQDGAGLVKPL